MRVAILMLVAAGVLPAQAPTALLPASALNQLCDRSLQLMEAGGVVVPDLARAAAPVMENVKQACASLKAKPAQGQPTYTILMNLRAYLTLADAVPKPFPFPDTARLQLAELRDQENRLDTHFRSLLESKETQLVGADRDELAHYAEANRRLGPPQSGKPRVVFLGDSITDSWRLNEYFPDRDFVNRGISGQITGQMLGRMKVDVIDLHPAVIVILGGTEDLAREIPLTAIEDNYVLLADLAVAAKIKVVFASVLPVNDYHKDVDPAYERTDKRPLVLIKALNDWISTFCAQRGYVFLNYVPVLVDSSGQMITDLSDDGLHPNSKGYRLMAPLAAQAVDRAMGTSTPAPPAAAPAPVVTPRKKK